MENKNLTIESVLTHLECTIENVGINATLHKSQEMIHKEAVDAVKSIINIIKENIDLIKNYEIDK